VIRREGHARNLRAAADSGVSGLGAPTGAPSRQAVASGRGAYSLEGSLGSGTEGIDGEERSELDNVTLGRQFSEADEAEVDRSLDERLRSGG
jgi:hypothetical protein